MNFTSRFILAVFCVNLFFTTASAQTKEPISGNFENVTFEQFIHEIEANSSYRFFYDSAETDTLLITVKANETPLNVLLDEVFKNTVFHYAIDASNNVYITKYQTIQTTFSDDFFNKKIPADTSGPEINAIAEERTGKQNLQSSMDNKLFEIGTKTNNPHGNATIAGYVRDAKNGEALIGATLYVDSLSLGTVTDQFGYYSITLPAGRHTLHINSVGMKEAKRQIMVYSPGKLNIDLYDYVPNLKAVVVTAERSSNIRSLQMGVQKLSIKTIKQVPVVFGEADVLRVVLTLPGVTSVGEASTGFNVRGGSTDQNLILYNDATIYNPSHLFGFFSAFNPDVIKGVELYKSAIPEKYGGRLSSVLDVSTKDGNSKKFSGTGGIGPLTSKLTVEGPIKKDKTSYIVSGRTTYSDWLLTKIPNSDYSNSRASFYDLNLHITHTLNTKNSFYLTGYLSNDRFRLNNDTLYKYGNRNANLKWKHIFNNKFYGVLTAGYDHYAYSISSKENPVTAYKLDFDINQINVRADFNYTLSTKHNLNFGINSIFYKLHSGSYKPVGKQSLVVPDVVQPEQALETALYLGDQYAITPKLSMNAGLRYSVFNYIGPHDVYTYVNGLPKDESTLQDTIKYASGKMIKTYHGPEFRFALRYALSDDASVKFSYNTLRQYIHMLSNTTAISPTDIWKLSDPNIKPQLGDQISLGFYKNFRSNTIETSVEIYFKNLKNYLDYKSGATLILNHHIETDVISTKGKVYGAELMIKKLSGKLNGWASYTYSRTLLKMDDPLSGEVINKGKYYPANFDKPHSANFILNYRFSHRLSISTNVIYSTGRPLTLPIAIFNSGGSQRLYYSERNQYRIPDYFRADFSFNIEGNHKIKQLTHNSWSFGVYNLTARKNAYSVYFVQENGLVKGYKLSIFGTVIPFVTYNFRF